MTDSDLIAFVIMIIASLILLAFAFGLDSGVNREREGWKAKQRQMLYNMMSIDAAEMNAREQILREMARNSSFSVGATGTDPDATDSAPGDSRTRRKTKEANGQH